MSSVQEKFYDMTAHFSELDGWQQRDLATDEQNSVDWQPPSQLSAEALQVPEQVGKVIKFTKEMFSGDFFTLTRRGACLVQLREQYLGIAFNEVFIRYEETTLPLQREILTMTEKVKDICENRDSSPDKSAWLTKVKNLAGRISDLYKKIQAELAEELRSPLANDHRVQKKVIVELSQNFQAPVGSANRRSHVRYLAKIAQMESEGKILKGVSQEDCWKWKGRVKGLERLQDQTLYTAHALYCLAQAIDPIMKKLEDGEFLSRVKTSADATDTANSEVREGAAFILKIFT